MYSAGTFQSQIKIIYAKTNLSTEQKEADDYSRLLGSQG